MMEVDEIVERYRDAMNRHDLEALVECFGEDYESVQPLNPQYDFRGRETVGERWSGIFQQVPDFRAESVRGAVKGPEGWNEWHWFGNRADGSTLDVWGVTILTCASDRIQSGRFYLEEHGS